MTMKQHILAAMREELESWEELLVGMSEELITTPRLPSKWSTKDVIVHLWAWQQRTIARVQAAQLNQEPEFPKWPPELDPEGDVQQVNAWIHETNRDVTWSTVHQNWRDGFLRLLELAEAIPEPDLLGPGGCPWLNGYPLSFFLTASYDHHQEHLDKTLHWLRRHNNTKNTEG